MNSRETTCIVVWLILTRFHILLNDKRYSEEVLCGDCTQKSFLFCLKNYIPGNGVEKQYLHINMFYLTFFIEILKSETSSFLAFSGSLLPKLTQPRSRETRTTGCQFLSLTKYL